MTCQLHRVKIKPPQMDQLLNLDPQDLRSLLAAEPESLLGHIIRLNRAPRYHNSLNAIALLSRLNEMRPTVARRTKTRK